jgi:hypothetical protein
MKNKLVITLVVLVLLGSVGAFIGYRMYNKPHPNVAAMKADVTFTAAALAKEYGADEKAADAKYLNKIIEVSGTISEVQDNQDGGKMVILATEDPAQGVQCSMIDKSAKYTVGQQVTVKGKCSGQLMGVSLTECSIK